MIDINNLVCKHILEMKPYASARSEFKGEALVYLDANENTLQAKYNRYPDPFQQKLKEQIGAMKKVNSEQIFLGNGSDEAIDLLLRIFCNAGQDAIITLPPTYGMYKVSASICNVENIEVPLQDNFQPNVELILNAQTDFTKLLFICSPNNPTGNDIDLEIIEALIKDFEGIVVVDEAYIDFLVKQAVWGY
jgi:histidinol-phosphate aminotransferase